MAKKKESASRLFTSQSNWPGKSTMTCQLFCNKELGDNYVQFANIMGGKADEHPLKFCHGCAFRILQSIGLVEIPKLITNMLFKK